MRSKKTDSILLPATRTYQFLVLMLGEHSIIADSEACCLGLKLWFYIFCSDIEVGRIN